MKRIFTLSILSILILPFNTSAQDRNHEYLEFLDQTDTSYVVYLGTFSKQKTFEYRDVPYALVEIEKPDGRFMYFFGKFQTVCDATRAQNLLYLAGLPKKKSKIKEYIDFKENPDVDTYAQVCDAD